LIATPAAPAIVDNAGAGSTLPAGLYEAQVTYVTAYGETLGSTPVLVSLTAAHIIRVPAIAGIAAGVTNVNVYVRGVKWGTMAVAANATVQTDFDGTGATNARIPVVNTAFKDNAFEVHGWNADPQYVSGGTVSPWFDVEVDF